MSLKGEVGRISSLMGAQAQWVLFPHPKKHRDRGRIQTSMFPCCFLQQPKVFRSPAAMQVPHWFCSASPKAQEPLWVTLLPSCPPAPTRQRSDLGPWGHLHLLTVLCCSASSRSISSLATVTSWGSGESMVSASLSFSSVFSSFSSIASLSYLDAPWAFSHSQLPAKKERNFWGLVT